MRRIAFVLVLFVASVAVGCGPTLGEYVAKSATYRSTIATTASVTVDIEAGDVVSGGGRGTFGAISSVLNTAAAVGAMALSADQNKRLQRLINSTKMAQNVAAGFDRGFVGATHLQSVMDASNPDLRIMLQISEYGLWAESIMSPMKFYIVADLRVVYTPEMTTVYRNGVSIMREVDDMLSEIAKTAGTATALTVSMAGAGYGAARVTQDVSRLIAGAANLTAFFKMTDAEIKLAFDYMATDAGAFVANQLVSDIYQ